MIQTNWIRRFYDPIFEAIPDKHDDDKTHIVYAAMLEGYMGCRQISTYTCLPTSTIHRIVTNLSIEGYVKRVEISGRKMYVPLGMNSEEL